MVALAGDSVARGRAVGVLCLWVAAWQRLVVSGVKLAPGSDTRQGAPLLCEWGRFCLGQVDLPGLAVHF